MPLSTHLRPDREDSHPRDGELNGVGDAEIAGFHELRSIAKSPLRWLSDQLDDFADGACSMIDLSVPIRRSLLCHRIVTRRRVFGECFNT